MPAKSASGIVFIVVTVAFFFWENCGVELQKAVHYYFCSMNNTARKQKSLRHAFHFYSFKPSWNHRFAWRNIIIPVVWHWRRNCWSYNKRMVCNSAIKCKDVDIFTFRHSDSILLLIYATICLSLVLLYKRNCHFLNIIVVAFLFIVRKCLSFCSFFSFLSFLKTNV